jgi:xanthine/uracil permease
MTEASKTIPPGPGKSPVRIAPKSKKPELLQSPGIVAASLYMLLLAFTIILGVARGHFPPICLVFPVFFIAAGLGLLKLFRWAWTLTLAAVAMLSGLFFWVHLADHAFPSLAQGLVNLVIFLYLVRTDIRNKLH